MSSALAQGDGLVRVTVRYRDKDTSVSMDSLLFRALRQREGGVQGAFAWVRNQVARVDALVDSGDLVALAQASLSRRVQRLALDELLPEAGEKTATAGE